MDNDTLNSASEFSIDEEAQLRLLEAAELIRRGQDLLLVIDEKEWIVRPTSQAQNQIMSGYDYDILHWQNELKGATTAKQAKRLNKAIRKAYAKKAAHKVLGYKLRWIPFSFSFMWRKIYHSSEKVSATINATEAIGENKVFYLANLGSSKQALALCMNNVGEAVKQRTSRGASAESMVEKDAMAKKEDSK